MIRPRSSWILRARVGAGVVVFLCLVGSAGSAAAQTEAAPPVATSGLATAPIGKMRLSVSVVPAPVGTWKSRLGNVDFSGDTEAAFGLRPAFDYSINNYFFVGFAPQFLFNVKGEDANGDAGKEVDFLLRVGGHAPVADRVHLFGYLAPGYSIVYPAQGNDASGFVLGVAGGAIFSISEKFFASAEIGYQIGYQEVTVGGADFDFHLSYLLVGLGVGMKL